MYFEAELEHSDVKEELLTLPITRGKLSVSVAHKPSGWEHFPGSSSFTYETRLKPKGNHKNPSKLSEYIILP